MIEQILTDLKNIIKYNIFTIGGKCVVYIVT